MENLKKLSALKDVVEEVLKENYSSRDDDQILIFETLKKLGFNVEESEDKITLNKNELHLFPSFESITRCRRIFQSQGYYCSDEIIQEKRESHRKDFIELSKQKSSLDSLSNNLGGFF
jgi:DNA-binding transcriptional MerR regulator